MNIGHVTSTALNGGDAPIFERAGADIKSVVKSQSEADRKLAAADAKIDKLTTLVEALLAQAAASSVPEETVEDASELTPAQKAAATRAANKAKAEESPSESE